MLVPSRRVPSGVTSVTSGAVTSSTPVPDPGSTARSATWRTSSGDAPGGSARPTSNRSSDSDHTA